MRRPAIGILLPLLLAAACGLKPELPEQIANVEVVGDESYEITYRWLIDGATDMLVHRGTSIFYVIQHAESLSIYPTYKREDLVTPSHKKLFNGLVEPRLLAAGTDLGRRLWVYDAGDGLLKGYDGGEFLEPLDVEISHGDPAWQDVAAVAADDEGRVFVADRAANKIYRYQVTGAPGSLHLAAAGQITWTSQLTGATVRDLDFAAGKLVLLDDGLKTIQLLDPAGVASPIFEYLSDLLADPVALVADADNLFVLDMADTSLWEIDADLDPTSALRVNTDDREVLRQPSAVTLNQGKVYVADPELGKVIDYEKRQ
ncbi:MAG: hypothetical protein JW819_08810 [Candidatus Krumholzibacteriota bacterium]|nr:hypothetical protein [Candidatus Krumholzibacteriota bacterium]